LIIQLTPSDPAGVAIHQLSTVHFDGPLERGEPVTGNLGMELQWFAPPGRYKISIKVHDEVANTNLEFTPSFDVNAAAMAPPHGLELRDFQLSRSENGPAESIPAIEGAGMVYMSANVFGLQFRDVRTTSHMSLKVLDPDGKVTLDQQDFLDLSESQYYRPPTYWEPVRSQLPIPADVKKGVYTLQYSITDNVANQTVMQEAKIEVK